MKQYRTFFLTLATAFCLVGFARPAHCAATAESLKVEALLIWGTDSTESPDPKHSPVDVDLAKRLSKTPFRWKHYFLVKREQVDIPMGATKSNIKMSKQCVLNIKNLGDGGAEVELYGEGKKVCRNRESLAHGKLLVLGGNAGNETAWFVVIRNSLANSTASK